MGLVDEGWGYARSISWVAQYREDVTGILDSGGLTVLPAIGETKRQCGGVFEDRQVRTCQGVKK